MEHVVVRQEASGYWMDPTDYQTALPGLAERLPAGARAFAQDPQHYDFASERCVHDLEFRSFSITDADGSARLLLAPNQFKHPVGLRLDYVGLVSVVVELDSEPGFGGFGSVLLDEILAVSEGFSHEIALIGGSLRIIARELQATWG